MASVLRLSSFQATVWVAGALLSCEWHVLQVLSLSRDAFFEVIAKRQRTVPELGAIVRRYAVRIAARRGIMAEARRRLQEAMGGVLEGLLSC